MASDRTARKMRRLEEQLKVSMIVNVILIFLLLVAIFMLFSGRGQRDVSAIVVDGEPIVYVRSAAEAKRLLEDVRNEKESGIGQGGDFDPEQTIEVKSVPAEGVTVSSREEAKTILGSTLRLLTQGWVITVDDDPVVTMANAQLADDVLNKVKSDYATVGEGDLIDQRFKEKVERSKAPVSSTELMTDIAGAAKKLTQKRGKESTYTVVSGDNPGKVAQKVGVTLAELYALNPTLKGRETGMKIGEKLKVSKPKAGVTVITVKKVQRKVEIDPQAPEQIETSALPKGSRKATLEPEKGVELQTAEVTYENDQRIGEKVVKQSVTNEPVRGRILVGTGPP